MQEKPEAYLWRSIPRDRDPPAWRTWARRVLADAGLLPAPVPAASLGDLAGLTKAAKAFSLALQQLVECSKRVQRNSAEWFAARLEVEFMLESAGALIKTPFGKTPPPARLAELIGDVIAAADREFLLPHARRGWKVAAGALSGGNARGRQRHAKAQHKSRRLLSSFDTLKAQHPHLRAPRLARLYLLQKDPSWHAGPDSDRALKIETLLRHLRRIRKDRRRGGHKQG